MDKIDIFLEKKPLQSIHFFLLEEFTYIEHRANCEQPTGIFHPPLKTTCIIV